jgi:hypothetical protein
LNLAKIGKNPAQFSSEDDEIILGISMQISAKIMTILEISNSQEGYIEKLLISINKTKKNILNAIISSIILQNDKEPIYLPKNLKDKVIEILTSLGKESSTIYSHNISKMLNEIEKDGILNNVKTKKEIKNLGFSKDFKNKRSEDGGYPSIHLLSPTIKEYKRILDNPNAIDKINQLLKKYGKLDQFYSLIIQSLLKSMISNPEEIRKPLQLMNKSIGSPLDKTEANFSNWNSMVEGAKLSSEKEIEDLCREAINNFIDKPNNFLYICFLIGS